MTDLMNLIGISMFVVGLMLGLLIGLAYSKYAYVKAANKRNKKRVRYVDNLRRIY